ncbi:hypothetical protein [Vibrio cyclitrophicus]|uniref:hypothetical protein n=1 Tax=Vibrio cyclitrophicus TaxID=47951 RepID=UPI0002D3312E|nr:hypothetical protein [Vibrio cyclitrophicus]OEF51784.1 hypothetical protein OAC_15190 [Vibrio cyclitrophicus 1F273]
MNIAFPAFFLLALILPGFIFTNAFERTENTTLDKKPFEASSASALMCALFLQLIYASFINFLIKEIDFTLCIKILTGVKLTQSDLESLSPDVGFIGIYFVGLYLASYVVGKVLQKVVFSLNPYKSSLLAFDTPWYYELKGKLSSESDAQIIKVSCLLDTKDGSYLYYGFLDDFYLDQDGQLDRIVLFDVYRRDISNDDSGGEGGGDRYYQIKGERLILKYNQIINLNIEYLYIYED